MADPIIRTNNVAVVYGQGSAKLRALDGVSIEIFPEEYIIFFGPSGCGKSTLLYTIAGLEAATEGSVIVNKMDISRFSREEKVVYHRSTIGMIFQAYYLITSLSVLQNVALPQIFSSISKADREKNSRALLKRFNILEQSEKIPNELSGGQQQRVAIARSLSNNAPLILADEPVGNLDSKSADTVLELLKDLNKTDKKTVIMVTHNPNHLHYADRVFYMKDGKVIREVRNENVKPEVKKEDPIPMMNFGLQEYAKMFPHLSEEELKAKMLTSYVLGEIDIETEEKLEKLVGEYMRAEITDEQFLHRSTRPLKKNGLGLYHAFAVRMLADLRHVLEMAQFLVHEYGNYPRTYEAYDKILIKLTEYLYTITEHKPSPEDTERVKKVLKSRLEGSLDHDEFQEFLDKSTHDGGAGLNIRTARNFARQFELVLLGFEERAQKRNTKTDNEKPHLFGMKSHGLPHAHQAINTPQKPKTPTNPALILSKPVGSNAPPTSLIPTANTQSLSQVHDSKQLPQQDKKVPEMLLALKTLTQDSSVSAKDLGVPINAELPKDTHLQQKHMQTTISTNLATSNLQNVTHSQLSQQSHQKHEPTLPETEVKAIHDSIKFFAEPSHEEKAGFIDAIKQALHHNAPHEDSLSKEPLAPAPAEKPDRISGISEITPVIKDQEQRPVTAQTTSSSITPAAQKSPHNAPMIFPQKLKSFTQESHENR